MSIKVLDEKTYSQIAAGEVIERPSSVIRELVDNSIDAKATEIEIFLTLGDGDFEIEVRDNGEGIEKVDLPLAIKRHATSKIREFSDVFQVETMGFRGEALASIASVSYLTLISSQTNDGKAAKMTAKGMEVEGIVSTMRERGTTLKVKNLFYNTPVRHKFLKTLATEKMEIKKEIIQKILATEGIGFTYVVKSDDKEKVEIHIPGHFDLKEKIYALFGKKVHDCLVEINGYFGDGDGRVWVEGYVTDQNYRGKLRKDQYFFLFGRPIQNGTLSKALNSAYINIMPTKTFCACFLKIQLKRDSVDVNVHPAKRDVKFEDADIVYRAVYHKVKDALYQNIYEKQKSKLYREGEIPSQDKAGSGTYDFLEGAFKEPRENEDILYPGRFAENGNGETIFPTDDDLSSEEVSSSIFKDEPWQGTPSPILTGDEAPPMGTVSKEIPENKALSLNVRILGQVADTYILFASGSDLYIVDQHAAHERLNFDRIKERIEGAVEYQYLLVPLVLDYPVADVDRVLAIRDKLKDVELEIEPFGDKSIKIERIPNYIFSQKVEECLRDIIEWTMDNPNAKKTELVEKTVSTLACRMSIMAGKKLTHQQMFDIIYELYRKDYVLNCPHGRPFVKKINLSDIEGFFERS